jgi:hypothetical protein
MTETPRREIPESVRLWIQAIAIPTVAIAWGAYTFYFKEILSPSIAPINLTTQVAVKEAGFGGASSGENKDQFEAIELAVTATNPSSRDVYLLPNYWRVMGVPIETRPKSDDWVENANTLIEEKTQPANAGAHYKAKKDVLVAAGSVFNDEVLHPNESISASFVFYVPLGRYDVLNVDVSLPTTAKQSSAWYVHKLKPDGTIESPAYRMANDDTLGAEITDFMAAYRDPTIQLQTAGSWRQLSLWRKGEDGTSGADIAGK